VVLENSRATETNGQPFRVGFSRSLFTDVNENDAEAAVKIWGQTIAKERGIAADTQTRIFQDTTQLRQALLNQTVDAVGISAIEYATVSREARLAPIFVTYNNGRYQEQYFVLVRRDSQLNQLADLRGRSLVFHQNMRACLAQPWLDTLLHKATGQFTAECVGKLTQVPKLSQAVLPVFFHQLDACVITSAEFEIMCELNPQIGQQLKIIATSPTVVTSVLCFRSDYAPAFKPQIFTALRDLDKTPAGQQVLTIFQSEKIEDQPASCMDSALELLAAHDRICGVTNATKNLASPQIAGRTAP
jgi:phosphonate transport system substrate-binding protein